MQLKATDFFPQGKINAPAAKSMQKSDKATFKKPPTEFDLDGANLRLNLNLL